MRDPEASTFFWAIFALYYLISSICLGVKGCNLVEILSHLIATSQPSYSF